MTSQIQPTWTVERSPLVHLINSAGRFAPPTLLGRFVADDLLAAARRKTGLDDFGTPGFEEPLTRLLRSIETEARLNPMGRMATRHDLLRLLTNRLRMEQERTRNPSIAAEIIRRPIIITGLPRTGTTLLHALLALDPASRVPLTWETVYPSPPPETATYRTDRRIGIVNGQIRWFHRLVKGFNRIHPVDACLPEECLVITAHAFLSYQFETTHRLPTYLDWLESQNLRPTYEVHRRFLQHLQWRCPKERWVLKAPAHMFDFGAMFSAYPDACVVMTHRDPLAVAASNASLTATLRAAFSDDIDPLEVGPECSRRWAEAIHRALRFRDAHSSLAPQFLDLYYAELIADPIGAVRKVYAHFALPFPAGFEDALRAFMQRNPKEKFGTHRYTLEQFGMTRDSEAERYALYRSRYQL